VRQFGDELRHARQAAGLSQSRVAAAAGVSQPVLSRMELAKAPHPDFIEAARVARVVGLELRLQCFPAGGQLRDVAHAALIARFLRRAPEAVRRQLEAPVGRGDLRAWDVLLTLRGGTAGVIAETRIRDLQALLRREHRKQLDSGVSVLVLVVARTKNNVRALSEAAELLDAEFPLRTRAVLAALARGEAPSANGIVVL